MDMCYMWMTTRFLRDQRKWRLWRNNHWGDNILEIPEIYPQ